MKLLQNLLLLALTAPSLCQAQAAGAAVAPDKPSKSPKPATQTEIIPDRTLKFAPADSDPTVTVSPVTSLPQCSSDGSLFLDMLDPKDLKKHTLVSIKGKKSQTYQPSAISDLQDINVFGFSPSDSMVGFLVRGTKESLGAPGPGKSPAGYDWSGYRNYIAEFNRDGSYKRAIELPVSYQLSHLALLPSGEFLVAGYDQLNSAGRLLFLDSSGQIMRTLDMPALRTTTGANAAFGSIEAARTSRNLIGSIIFTPYDQDVLVWRRGSKDPILDVGPGGRVREVLLNVPPGYVFVDMVSANDRWVGHFRRENAVEKLT